jgi:hypothetical protein
MKTTLLLVAAAACLLQVSCCGGNRDATAPPGEGDVTNSLSVHDSAQQEAIALKQQEDADLIVNSGGWDDVWFTKPEELAQLGRLKGRDNVGASVAASQCGRELAVMSKVKVFGDAPPTEELRELLVGQGFRHVVVHWNRNGGPPVVESEWHAGEQQTGP